MTLFINKSLFNVRLLTIAVWLDPDAVGENLSGERRLRNPKMIAQHALEDGANVGGRRQVAVLVERLAEELQRTESLIAEYLLLGGARSR